MEIIAKGHQAIIRSITAKDAPVFTKWMESGFAVESIAFTEYRRFVILDRKTEQPVGEIAFGKMDYQKRSCKIGLKIGEVNEQEEDTPKEALSMFMDYLYDRYGLWRIQSALFADNQGALKLFRDVGFQMIKEISDYGTDSQGKVRNVVFLEHQREPQGLLDLLEKRCSVRDFAKEPVAEEVISEILEAGRLAPSGGNEQPWKFALIKDRELMKRLVESAYNQVWMLDADFWIVTIATIIPDERGGRDIQAARYPDLEERIRKLDLSFYGRINQEEHQTKIPGTQMVLTALEYGVGSTWVSYFKVDEVREHLGLASDEIPSEILAFGYPQTPMKSKRKKPMDSILLRYE